MHSTLLIIWSFSGRGKEMVRNGYLDYCFEILIDRSEVDKVQRNTYVLRDDLWFSLYEVIWDGQFEEFEEYEEDEEEYDNDGVYYNNGGYYSQAGYGNDVGYYDDFGYAFENLHLY